MYKGVIIEESLSDATILQNLKIIETEVGEVTEAEETPWLDVWTLHTVEIEEDKIDDYTRQLSELIETEHCDSWYCDFRNEKYHYVVFSNKVFKLDRSKKEDYVNMQKYAESIGLPSHQMPSFDDLPLSLLMGFLKDAKKETYANEVAPKANSSRVGSKDYQYEALIEGEKMIYHDTYFGGTKFMGEEVVYRGSDRPKWGMNYYGETLDDSLSEEVMDKVLRPALMKVGEDSSVLPVRGPSRFENGEFLYTFSVEGDIDSFTGIEEIYKNGKLIYRLNCHGGMIE
ncbi:MAG: hypothetical protein K2M17_06390 [Bacilli bacterium]|nr:hypothetical protein [Bacilli bacterium]